MTLAKKEWLNKHSDAVSSQRKVSVSSCYLDNAAPELLSSDKLIFGPNINPIIICREESVLLGTKPLVNCIGHFIREPSGVYSVCHLCECRIVQ